MSIPWYEWGTIRHRLAIFGRALQGTSPYRVVIEPDRHRCPTGYCNFTRKEIAVNPNLFAVSASRQYQLTKALLVHEAGHRRFTTPERLTPLVQVVSNILEDERIERQMAAEFAGVRWLIHDFSERLYAESQPIDAATDSPGEVVAYFLQLRWATRIGQPVKGGLSARNHTLWQRVEPLVYEAWQAETTEVVNRHAAEIVGILGLVEYEIPPWAKELLDKLGRSEGDRTDEDGAEIACGNGRDTQAASATPAAPEPFDGEILPNDKSVGYGGEAIVPQAYRELEAKVRPWAEELIEELSWQPEPRGPDSSERGGRFSVREYLRERRRPFLVEEEERPAPPTLAVRVLIDHSTSLNLTSGRASRIEAVAEAVMTLHLVCVELAIAHEVWVTPQDVKIADLGSGEAGKALIAGLFPARCGYEDMGKAIETHVRTMVECPEDIKLALCLTDGACNDAEVGKLACRMLRGKVEIIGVLLDPDERTHHYVNDMFGADRVIGCRSEELPRKLGNILRSIRGI